MSNIDTLLERSAAEIRDASATFADRHWDDVTTPRRGFGRATMVAAAFAATILLVGGTALVFSAISGQPSSDTFDGSVNEQVPPVADETTPPTTAFVTQSADAARKLTVDRVTASSELSPAFAAENLIDGDPAISWNDASLSGEGAVLGFDFGEPVFLNTIVIHNYDNPRDPRSFKRNARVKDIEVEYHTADGTTIFSKATAPDTTEPFTIPVGAFHDGPLVIRVVSVWPAEAVGDAPPFLELAIGEVEFFGTVINDEWTESEWVESAIRDMKQTIAAFEADIATLTSALESASLEAAQEIRDRLASANSGRDAAIRRLLELEKKLTLINLSDVPLYPNGAPLMPGMRNTPETTAWNDWIIDQMRDVGFDIAWIDVAAQEDGTIHASVVNPDGDEWLLAFGPWRPGEYSNDIEQMYAHFMIDEPGTNTPEGILIVNDMRPTSVVLHLWMGEDIGKITILAERSPQSTMSELDPDTLEALILAAVPTVRHLLDPDPSG